MNGGGSTLCGTFARIIGLVLLAALLQVLRNSLGFDPGCFSQHPLTVWPSLVQ